MDLGSNLKLLRLGKLVPFFALFALFISARANAILPIPDRPYTLTSDYVMLDVDNKVAYCEGQSELTYGLMRIQADTIRVDIHTHLLYAEGRVIIQSMVNRNLTGAHAQEQNQVAGTIEVFDMAKISDGEREAAQERIIQESIKKGYVQTFDGDVLLYDLVKYSGVIFKTKDEVSRTYLYGDALDVVADQPNMVEPEYLYEEPDIMTNAWTAKKLRINRDSTYEAWQAKVWFKGNKVLPTAVPYYTNSGKGFTPGNLRLKRLRYSSNTDWNVGALYTYSKKKDKRGTVGLDYSGDGAQTYSANLSQAFSFSKNLSGSMGLGNMFTGSHTYGLVMNRNMGGSKRQSFDGHLYENGRKYISINDNRLLGKKTLTTNFSISKYSTTDTNQASSILKMTLGHRNRYIGKSKGKVSFKLNTTLEHINEVNRDSDTNAFVGVALSRTGIKLPLKAVLSPSVNLGYGMHTDGYTNDSYSMSMRVNRGVGKNKSVGVGYSIGQNRNLSGTRVYQNVSLLYNFNAFGMSKFSMSLSSTYNLRTNSVGNLNTHIRYPINKRSEVTTDLNYEVGRRRFSTKNYNLRYDLYGSDLNARWYVESNDFMLDLATKF